MEAFILKMFLIKIHDLQKFKWNGGELSIVRKTIERQVINKKNKCISTFKAIEEFSYNLNFFCIFIRVNSE